MNTRNIIGIIIGLGALIFIGCGLTGCGNGSDSGSSDDGNNPPVVQPEDPVVVDGGDSGGDTPPPTETIAGNDADGNGVWDYIDTYIDATYPSSEKTRTALREYAKNLQISLLDAEDEELSVQHASDGSYRLACIRYVLPDDAYEVFKTLRAEILNTDERSRAYILHDSQLGGHVFTGQLNEAASCNFDVDSLAN